MPRLYFDLIGLLPVLTEVNGIVNEELLALELDLAAFRDHPDVYLNVVARLLDSPGSLKNAIPPGATTGLL